MNSPPCIRKAAIDGKNSKFEIRCELASFGPVCETERRAHPNITPGEQPLDVNDEVYDERCEAM